MDSVIDYTIFLVGYKLVVKFFLVDLRGFIYFAQFRKHIVIAFIFILCDFLFNDFLFNDFFMGCITIITIITALANEDNKNKSHTHSV